MHSFRHWSWCISLTCSWIGSVRWWWVVVTVVSYGDFAGSQPLIGYICDINVCRNQRLFCPVFHLDDHVWSTVLLKGWSIHALLIQEYLICFIEVCMNPALNESLVIQCFKHGDAQWNNLWLLHGMYVKVVLVSNPLSMYHQSFIRDWSEIYRR